MRHEGGAHDQLLLIGLPAHTDMSALRHHKSLIIMKPS
jgi:hypothetical protein